MNKILLIENENSGKSYVELVSKSIENIDIIWVKNRKQALDALKGNEKYKVIVYDQRLDNNELGTEIMLELKEIDKNLLGIMLSAYATPQDTAQAGKNGILFDYCNKNQVQNLPIKIMEALKFYDLNKALNTKQEKKFIGKLHRKHSLLYPLRFYIVSQVLIDDNYVFENSWEDLYIINAGEEQCHKKAVEISREIKITNSIDGVSQNNVSIDKLKNLISSSFENKVSFSKKEEYVEQNREVEEVVKTYKMPPIPQSVDEDYLTTTIFQCGQVYKKYDIEILQECSLCETPSYHQFTIYIPTCKQQLRKINTYRFGYQEIVEVSPRV